MVKKTPKTQEQEFFSERVSQVEEVVNRLRGSTKELNQVVSNPTWVHVGLLA